MQESENVSKLKRLCWTASTVARVLQVLTAVSLAAFIIVMLAFAALRWEIFVNPFEGTTDILWLSLKTQDLIMSNAGIAAITVFGVVGFGLIVAFFTLLCKTFALVTESHSPFTKETRKNLMAIAVIAVVLTLLGGNIPAAFLETITLFALFLMFDYACELQVQSDETL